MASPGGGREGSPQVASLHPFFIFFHFFLKEAPPPRDVMGMGKGRIDKTTPTQEKETT
jgi:hypothetical protein